MMITDCLKEQKGFSAAEKEIADYLLKAEDLEGKSAGDIAKELYISPSALTRFAQKLGFTGFSDFRKAYTEEVQYLSSHFQNIDPNFPFAAAGPKDEVYILMSYSGETPQIIKTAKKLSALKIPFLAIASYGQNTLSSLTDTVLYVSTREKMIRCLGSCGMPVSAMYLPDTLYSCVFRFDYAGNLKARIASAEEYQDERTSYNPVLRDKDE